MKLRSRKYMRSFTLALVLTLLTAVVASVPGLDRAGMLLLPGIAGAAIFFPDGIHSNWPQIYMALAGLRNAFLFAWIVLGLWALIERISG